MAPGSSALATTKFLPPAAPAGTVPRPRLHRRLDEGAAKPLTLLAASAGAGKTALVSSWVAARGEPTAWLTLDRLDGDPRRFWRGVLEALKRAGVGDPVASLAVPPTGRPDLLLPALVSGLEELAQPIVLVLDDLQEIAGSAALDNVDRLLRLPPTHLRVIAATRADPPLRLGRMRAAGEMLELRGPELAFTAEETEELLRSAGLDAPALAERLRTRTEGWAAGLRLATIALRQHPDPAQFVDRFTGTDSTVADYLLAEVVAGCSPATRDFLLRISVVDDVSAELAEHLTDRADAGRVLHQLQHEHALLASAGAQPAWYRLHPLFAALLRSELEVSMRAEVPALHRRAARWYRDVGRPVEALMHARAARDWRLASELAGAHWVALLLEGELGALRPMLATLPHDLGARDPDLALAVAAAHVDAGDEQEAGGWVARALAARDMTPPARPVQFKLGLSTVELLRSGLRGDVAAAVRHARSIAHAEAELGDVDDDLRGLALCHLGMVELWAGDFQRARTDLELAHALAAAVGCDWVVVQCLAHLGVHAMMSGRYARATALSSRAEALAHRRGWSATWPVGVAAGTRSAVALQRDQIDEADAQSRRATELLSRSADRPLRSATALQRARIDVCLGRPETALEAVGETREWLRGWPVSAPWLGLVDGVEATVMAALGEQGRATERLASAAGTQEAAVAIARLELQSGDPEHALEALSPFLGEPASPFAATRTETWVTAALAHDARADRKAARQALERALTIAAPGGLRRPFVHHGRAIAPLLRRHRAEGTSHGALVDDLLAAIGQPGDGRPPAVFTEALSDREAALLRYLPTMMSNREIADALFVSVNTVKTHLKSIYRKLDVDHRRGAVERARELRLVAHAASPPLSGRQADRRS